MVKRNKDQEPQEKVQASDLSRSGSNAAGLLFSFVERVERLTEEAEAIADDRKEVYAEAKAHGFDTAILRKVIQRRKMNAADRNEVDALMELYEEAIKEAEKRQVAQSVAEGA